MTAGRPRFISNDEAGLINDRLKLVSSREFGIEKQEVKQFLSRVSVDDWKGYKNGIPSDEAVRTHLAQNSDILYKRIENKEHAKLVAESFSNMDTFFGTLDDIQRKHPGIFLNANLVWDLEKTADDCTLGKRHKAFTAKDTKNGSNRGVKSTYGSSKHITAVIPACTASVLTPPCFIIAGKRKNEERHVPVTISFTEPPQEIIKPFAEKN